MQQDKEEQQEKLVTIKRIKTTANLMSIDVQKISGTLTYLHMAWSGLFQIAFCLISLFYLIGWVTIAGVFVMILLIPIQGISTRVLQKLREQVLKYTDQRVKTVNEILQGMRIIKFFTWESSFMKKIHSIRSSEVWQFIKGAIFSGILGAIMTSSPTMVSVCTFLLYVLIGNKLVSFI
jgi:ABC-type multidrug transport system fused ATPase/permease subunit